MPPKLDTPRQRSNTHESPVTQLHMSEAEFLHRLLHLVDTGSSNSEVGLIISSRIAHHVQAAEASRQRRRVEDLPVEILLRIFDYLPRPELGTNVVQVCKRWRDVGYDFSLFGGQRNCFCSRSYDSSLWSEVYLQKHRGNLGLILQQHDRFANIKVALRRLLPS